MLAEFQNSCTIKFSKEFAINPCQVSHYTLHMLQHYLVKCKTQNSEILVYVTLYKQLTFNFRQTKTLKYTCIHVYNLQ